MYFETFALPLTSKPLIYSETGLLFLESLKNFTLFYFTKN